MSNELFSKYLIKTSENYFLYIHLDDKNYILLDKFNKSNILIESKILIDEPVIDFSANLGNTNAIYLLYLNKYGELKYSKINNKNISSNIITKLDLRSNIYSNLKLITRKNSIHIFYSYKNYINSKIWTIQHIIGEEGKWEKNTVISISSSENMQPFHVSFDNLDNIHLIYEALEKNNQNVYYMSYTPFLHKWNKSPHKLSEGLFDCNQSCLFIDSKDNVHVIWCSTPKNNHSVIQYRQSLTLGKFQRNWKSKQLPINDNNFFYPIMFEEKGILKIIYKSHNLIKILYSQDYGYTWNLGDSLNCPNDIFPITYLSNNRSFNTKINRIYALITDKVQLFGLSNNNDFGSKISKTNASNQTLTKNNSTSKNTEFNNEEIIKFIQKTNKEINNLIIHVKPDILKKEINSIINRNAKLLDENIKYNKNISEQVLKNIEKIEVLIKNYIDYIKQIDNIINYLKENYNNNIIDTKQILTQIDQLNTLIENEKNKSLLKRIISLLK